jgi:hypothetical protein
VCSRPVVMESPKRLSLGGWFYKLVDPAVVIANTLRLTTLNHPLGFVPTWADRQLFQTKASLAYMQFVCSTRSLVAGGRMLPHAALGVRAHPSAAVAMELPSKTARAELSRSHEARLPNSKKRQHRLADAWTVIQPGCPEETLIPDRAKCIDRP